MTSLFNDDMTILCYFVAKADEMIKIESEYRSSFTLRPFELEEWSASEIREFEGRFSESANLMINSDVVTLKHGIYLTPSKNYFTRKYWINGRRVTIRAIRNLLKQTNGE